MSKKHIETEPTAEEWVADLEYNEINKLDQRLGLTDDASRTLDPETLPYEIRQKVYHLLSERKKAKAESDAAQDAGRSNSIKENPFYLLNVRAIDSRVHILDQVQSRSLTIDEALCQKAATSLTNPRTRLAAELSWFAGIDPEMSEVLLSEVNSDLMLCAQSTQLGAYRLARANIISAALEQYTPTNFLEPVFKDIIVRLCYTSPNLDADSITKLVNRDRAKSGFALIQNTGWVEEEIENRRKHYKKTLTACLDRMPTDMMVRLMTTLAITQFPANESTPLFNELIDAYELGAQNFLNKEFENIEKLVDVMINTINSPNGADGLLTQLNTVLRNWIKVARPIQVNMHHRGLAHPHSERVIGKIRGLSIELCNEHSFYSLGLRVTGIMLNAFDEELSFYSKLQDDAKLIRELLEQV